MSVIKSKRGESSVQFIDTAARLEAHALYFCVKAPKRYAPLVTDRIFALCSTVHEEVRAANNIYPTNEHEYQMRKDHLTNAIIALYNIDPKLQLIYDVILKNPENFKWADSAMETFGLLIEQEVELISKVKKSDKERFRKFIQHSEE